VGIVVDSREADRDEFAEFTGQESGSGGRSGSGATARQLRREVRAHHWQVLTPRYDLAFPAFNP
jgi:hypothetical protein